jgi:hypothetical protein
VGLCHFLSAQKVAQKGAPAASWSLLKRFFSSLRAHIVCVLAQSISSS